MECCSLEVMAELLLEPAYSSQRKHRSCLIYGESLPRIYLWWPVPCITFQWPHLRHEEGPHSSETPCSHPSITRPSMWRSVPDRLPPSQGIKQNLTPPIPLKECLGNLTQSMHAVVRAQRWEGTESLIPTMIVFLESMQPTSRY